MFAVVMTGGKQYRVEPGEALEVERLSGEIGESVQLGDVLLLDDGESVRVGRPKLEGVSVTAEIVGQIRAKKLVVFKKIRRQGKKLKKGHRQGLTRVRITNISVLDSTDTPEAGGEDDSRS